jgi:isopenicillin N synthase-like dioxygenase
MYIQAVDFNDEHAHVDFVNSLRRTGFAVIKNHPISPLLMSDTIKEWAAFFASHAKHDYTFKTLPIGYIPFKSENAKGYSAKDLKEFYHYYPQHGLPQGMSDNTSKLYEVMEEVACTTLQWIEDSLPADIKDSLCMSLSDMVRHSKESLLRIIHYPPLTGIEEEDALRAQAHEDINLITILPAASAPGLQVRDLNGKWHDIHCEPGEIVINCADTLQLLTRHHFISTTHRVINPEGANRDQPRYSMPFFLHTHSYVKLSDKHTQESYLQERLNEIGLVPTASASEIVMAEA